MNTMTYKGYIGSIEVSVEDNCLLGKVLSVDDYLAMCEAEGIEPHKSYSGALNVGLIPDRHSQVAVHAKQAGISINAFIKKAVQNQIAAML